MDMEKVVQTRLEGPMYQRLAARAQKEGRSLRAVVHDAIDAYLRGHEELPPIEEDPLWELVGSGDLPAGDWSERKDWRRVH